jgi:hypothetical protein
MKEWCFTTGFVRTALTDYFTGVGANCSQQTTTFAHGTKMLQIDLSTANFGGSVTIAHRYAALRKNGFRFDFKFSANPANQVNIINIDSGKLKCGLLTAVGLAKIQVSSSSNAAAIVSGALTIGTEYEIEIYFDKDASTYGTIGLYINGSLTTYNLVVGDTAPTAFGTNFGSALNKGSTTPAIITYFANLFVYYSDGTGAYPRIGTIYTEEVSRVPIAVGAANDFVASSGTNKYDLVDESPANTTDYVYKDMVGGPVSNITLTLGAAGGLNGTYNYAVTFITATGETDAAGLSPSAAPVNQKVEISAIPVNPYAACTGRRIYRSAVGGGSGALKLLTTINDNTTTTFSDNIADGSLGAALPTTNTANPVARQRFTFTNVAAYTGNIKGACFFSTRYNSLGMSAAPNSESVLDNSVEYNLGLGDLTAGSSWRPENYGFATRPGDNSVFSAANLNAIEHGMKLDWASAPYTGSYEERISTQFMVVATDASGQGGGVTPTTVTKSLKYTVKTTPSTITKGLIYKVKTSVAAITKSLHYSVKHSVAAITKSLHYSVKHTPATITKGLKYTVKASVAAITKSLHYSVRTTPTTITKSLRYAIKAAVTIQKSVKYTVKTTPATITKGLIYKVSVPATPITKSLKYTVTITPSTLTKSLRYSIKASVAAITKAAKYTVKVTPATLTKGLIYSVKITPTAITKAIKYAVISNPAALTKGLIYRVLKEPAITKSLKYTVTAPHVAITKGLIYKVRATPAAITKGLIYSILKAATITKDLNYTILTTPEAITKALVYAVRTTPTTITASLQYAVKAAVVAIEKTLEYRIEGAAGTETITKALQYAIKITPATITKSLRYAIKITPETITKSLKYSIRSKPAITKALIYTVKTSKAAIQLGLTYVLTVTTTKEITKELKYRVKTTPATIQKSLQYIVRKTLTITKSLKYTVKATPTKATKVLKYTVTITPATITKALQYIVRQNPTITKGLVYKVKAGIAITKPLAYTIVKAPFITKALVYRILLGKPIITKSLQYKVEASPKIKLSLRYVIAGPDWVGRQNLRWYAEDPKNAFDSNLGPWKTERNPDWETRTKGPWESKDDPGWETNTKGPWGTKKAPDWKVSTKGPWKTKTDPDWKTNTKGPWKK